MRLEGYVRVTNHGSEKIIGRYDGDDYEFPVGKPIDVPEVVAQHIFAFGKTDKSQAMARLGWAVSSDGMPGAMQRLGELSFDEPPEMVEVVRARPPTMAGPARPRVNASEPEVVVADSAAIAEGTDSGEGAVI